MLPEENSDNPQKKVKLVEVDNNQNQENVPSSNINPMQMMENFNRMRNANAAQYGGQPMNSMMGAMP
jgi:hypothetical protein